MKNKSRIHTSVSLAHESSAMAKLHVTSYILMLISTLKLVDSTCTYLGRTYKTADRFPKGESCNMCTCRESGKVDCTTITCYQFPKCRYNGLVHEAGSRFPAGDGCNECICTTLGAPQCTKYKCYPDCTYNGLKYKKGQTFPKGDKCNNYCTCTVTGKVECTQNTYCFSDCVYNGQTYSTGQEFQSSDGCRVCQCTADGSYTCSENYCLRDSNNLVN